MARDQKTEQKQPTAEVQTTDAPVVTAPPATQYVQSGAIPPVETAAARPAPSASDRAYGKGMQALQAMLAQGTPKASDIATLIDAHRDEHDQMLALVQQKLGDGFVASVRADLSGLRASISNKEVVAGDPGNPSSDYLDISQAQGGAKWKAAGGNFTGTADKNGLDTTVKASAHDSIHAQVKSDKSGTVDWNHDGTTEATLGGTYKDGKNYNASLARTQDVAGASVTEGVKHDVADGKASDSVYADVKKGTTTAHADVGLADGKPAEHLSATTKAGSDTITGSVGHDAKGTTAELEDSHDFGGGTTASADVKRDAAGAFSESGTLTHKGAKDQETATIAHDSKGTTGSLTGSYDAGNTQVDGSVARTADAWKLHAGATEKVSPAVTLSGKVDETLPDKGKNQTDVSLSETYSSGKVIQGLDVEGGKGAHDYLKATGSVGGQLAPNLYGSAWGSYSYEAGKQDTAQIGASLTLTRDEKEALTLAGVVDQHGRFETRLQFDVFKDRINSISALDQHKKDAVVSLFLSYSQQVGGHRALDDRFGAPSIETPNNASQVMAGIRIRF